MSSSETDLAVSVQSSSATDSIELELLQTSSQRREEWTARDTASVRLQLLGRVLCCTNKPRIRWIRSKGAILVLLWNCLVLTYYGNLGHALGEILRLSSVHDGVIYLILTLIYSLSQLLLYPLAGWIADVYFGRYQVIKVSLWLMWTGAILLSSSLCINMLLSPNHESVQVVLNAVFFPVALLAMGAGIAGFNVNVIPFGIDQLSTGSGDQLSAFITWWVFTSCIKWGLLVFPFSCPWTDSHPHNVLLQILFQAVLVSAALILNSLCRDWLIKEPYTSNPLKLVATVLRYAWKNKQPQFRSAFTYQDHTKPSRIEFAKSKFGGPFTTEQVEDVKTFLRILFVLVPLGATLVLTLYVRQAATLFSDHVNSNNISCFGYQAISNYFSFFTVVCAVPLYEFLIHPVMHYYIPTMLTRFGIGIIFYILSCVALFTIDLIAHGMETESINYTCIFDEAAEVNRLHINPLWTMLPKGLIGLGIFFNVTSLYEFVFSQSPHNMKGLLMGAVFATTGAIHIIGLSLQVPFYLGYVDHMTTVPSCGSVYLLVWLALTIVWFIVYVIFARSYHRRERGETERQQGYPEEYYSKYLRNRHQ